MEGIEPSILQVNLLGFALLTKASGDPLALPL